MSKIYLHYDGDLGPCHTFIWRNAAGLTFTGRNLGQALDAFVASYHRKHGRGAYDGGKGMHASRLRLVADAPDPFGGTAATALTSPRAAVALDTASNVAMDPAVVHPGCDLRVEERGPGDVPVVSKGAVASTAAAFAPAPPAEGVAAAKAGGNAPAKAKKLTITAEKLMARKNLRGARDAAKEALVLDPSNARALRCLTDLYRKAGLWDEAFNAAKECCSKLSDGETPADLLRAGRCLFELKKLKEATTALGRARTAGKGSLVDDADAALALCRFHMGDAPGAGDMYMEVLRRTGEKHVESLVGYGRLALLFNQADKGMPSLLKAVMLEQENKEAREVLAGGLGMPEGMKALKEQVVPSLQTASVYSFLGTIAKDHGEIDASVELLRVAGSVDPGNASCALGLVHGHEIRGDYARALAAAKSYLAGNSEGGVGARGVRNSVILGVLEGVSISPASSSHPPKALEGLGEKAVYWTTLKGGLTSSFRSPSPSSGGAGGSGGSDEDDISFAWCEDAPAPGTAAAAASEAPPGGERAGGDEMEVDAKAQADLEAEEKERRERKIYKGMLQAGGGGKEMYAAKDLDVLALYFAVVKILYLEGKWSCLPRLLDHVEPARIRSLMPLHKTTIRNEQAYYCCIIQLLASWSSKKGGGGGSGTDSSSAGDGEEKAVVAGAIGADGSGESSSSSSSTEKGKGEPQVPASNGTKDVVYVCGDSHTLTPAWHEVMVGGRPRVLRPALVTGLKHWHLRPGSNFYPKKNFESVMAKVPNGSAVVFILGEIDCREGILVAVDKLRYNTTVEGVEHTVGIFIKVAEALSKERGLRIYVHPVIPVLNETRGMVKIYNCVFRRMVDKSKHLHWLDLFDQLLDDAGENLRPEFRLDGTHLGPSYVDLLEKALGDAWVEGAPGKRKGKSK